MGPPAGGVRAELSPSLCRGSESTFLLPLAPGVNPKWFFYPHNCTRLADSLSRVPLAQIGNSDLERIRFKVIESMYCQGSHTCSRYPHPQSPFWAPGQSRRGTPPSILLIQQLLTQPGGKHSQGLVLRGPHHLAGEGAAGGSWLFKQLSIREGPPPRAGRCWLRS